MNGNLQQIERHLGVKIHQRGNHLTVSGSPKSIETSVEILTKLYAETELQPSLSPDLIHLYLSEIQSSSKESFTHIPGSDIQIKTRGGLIRPRGDNQATYLKKMRDYDINFGIGPAGTGKTYLAVACAVDALQKDEVKRILLVRPAVEAGEKLGFLPGDLAEKINPYLRPLYDALYEMLGFEQVNKLLEKQVIEVAPLAYMRGRTLNHSFIILDESQNTTPEQMKMFLTRIGFGSKAVITGDPSQTDLPSGAPSGLHHSTEVLEGIKGIGFTIFKAKDVVRHSLVQRIVEAYDARDKSQAKAKAKAKASKAQDNKSSKKNA
ncbi:MAG: PhoH family protein [Pseudomonadales bacterium]|nr:PhoH family protein [Pseudomonadales bacterium]